MLCLRRLLAEASSCGSRQRYHLTTVLSNRRDSFIGLYATSSSGGASQSWRFDNVPLGSQLQLHVKGHDASTNVSMKIGEPEALEMNIVDATTTGIDETLTVQNIPSTDANQYRLLMEAAKQTQLRVTGRMPTRYFGLDIDIHKGNIEVETIAEAKQIALSVVQSGNIKLGSMSASSIGITSKGSATLSANLLQGEHIAVEVAAGSISVKNIRGNNVSLSARGIALGALYADYAQIKCTGQVLQVQNLFCSQSAIISAVDAETVHIGGVDGSLELNCGKDTDATVYINENAKQINVQGGNKVDILLGSDLGITLETNAGCEEVALPQDGVVSSKHSTSNGKGCFVAHVQSINSTSSPNSPQSRLYRGSDVLGSSEDAGARPEVAVAVNGARTVHVRRVTWMDRATLKLV